MLTRSRVFVLGAAIAVALSLCVGVILGRLSSDSDRSERRWWLAPREADWTAVRQRYHQVSVGMPMDKVIELLGQPDIRNSRYRDVGPHAKPVGATLFYLELPAMGVGTGREEVRVYLDLDGRVVDVYAILFEEYRLTATRSKWRRRLKAPSDSW